VEFRYLRRYVSLPRVLFEPESRCLEADGRLRLEHQVGTAGCRGRSPASPGRARC